MMSFLELVLLIIVSHAWLVDIYEFFRFCMSEFIQQFKTPCRLLGRELSLDI